MNQIEELTQTEAGLFIPLNELEETEGGKITTRPSKKKYYAKGKVLQVAEHAQEKLKQLAPALKLLEQGDEVLISKQVLNNDSFYFYFNREKLVQDFKGIICIPHTLIEAIL